MSSAPQALRAPAAAMGPVLMVVVLSLLLGIQPVTTDLYLPALPALSEALGGTMSQAQRTLSAMLLAFGLSQLVWGPLSDRFGRRPILLSGMALFTAASVGCGLAADMPALVAWRALQGVAMGAAVMAGRAVIRDCFAAQDGARMMSRAMTGLGVIACLSAPLGTLLAEAGGWRWALAAPAAFGALTLALLALRFEETLPAHRRQPFAARAMASAWAGILRHPVFLGHCALATATFAGLFVFLAASSFVFMRVLGLSRPQYGLAMCSMSAVYIAGTFACRRLLARLGPVRTLKVAGAVALMAGTAMGLLALAGVKAWWAVLLPQWLFMLAHGVHQPMAQSGAVAPFPRAAGAASALNGFVMTAVAFVLGDWIGRHLDGGVFALTHGVWFWGACVALLDWVVMPRIAVLRDE